MCSPSVRRRCPFLDCITQIGRTRALDLFTRSISRHVLCRFQQKRISPCAECQGRWVPRGRSSKAERGRVFGWKAHFFVDQMAKLRCATKLECWGAQNLAATALNSLFYYIYTVRAGCMAGRWIMLQRRDPPLRSQQRLQATRLFSLPSIICF